MFLISAACRSAYGQTVQSIFDSTLFNIAIVIVTRVLLTLSATPFSCSVCGFVRS
jgi:hypothetical protein